MSIQKKILGAMAMASLSLFAMTAQALEVTPEPQLTPTEPIPENHVPKNDFAVPAQQSYWGFGMGYVFNKVPISLSTFNVFLSDLWYTHIFGDPMDKTRIAGTLGFYGFEMILPVPKASVDFYVGKPTEDIQFKAGIGGFYDIAVGGHAGVDGEIGVVLKNRVDISFMAVPLGTDSKRSYSE